jgi:hypothetical protein
VTGQFDDGGQLGELAAGIGAGGRGAARGGHGAAGSVE